MPRREVPLAAGLAAYTVSLFCYPGGFDIGLMVLPWLIGWVVYRTVKWIAQ